MTCAGSSQFVRAVFRSGDIPVGTFPCVVCRKQVAVDGWGRAVVHQQEAKRVAVN